MGRVPTLAAVVHTPQVLAELEAANNKLKTLKRR
jgi:hypothetical protein